MILIITAHKCASTLQRRIFKAISLITTYKHIDYAGIFWKSLNLKNEFNNYREWIKSKGKIEVKSKHIYGPIRHELNIDNKLKKIIILRDPCEVLISEYYSFGFTHKIPIGDFQKSDFLERRGLIQKMTLEKYIFSRIEELYKYYLWISKNTTESDLILPFNSLVKKKNESIKSILKFIGLSSHNLIAIKSLVRIAELKAGRNFKKHTMIKADNKGLNQELQNIIRKRFEQLEYLFEEREIR